MNPDFSRFFDLSDKFKHSEKAKKIWEIMKNFIVLNTDPN